MGRGRSAGGLVATQTTARAEASHGVLRQRAVVRAPSRPWTRKERTRIDSLAEWVCFPCLLAAWVLYAMVTWVPKALFWRDLLIGALVMAALGAALARLPRGNPIRAVGATIMALALMSALCILLW